MWELDHKEGWELKNWCFWIVVLAKTLQNPLDSKEIKPVSPKGNQSWIFIERIDAEAEALILWPPDVKSQLTGKDPDAGKDWGQEEKRAREWDGWMASPNQWTWVWANSSRQWWTGKPEVLQSMGSQRVWHNLVTEQQHDNSHEPRSHNWQLVRPSSEWARIHICHSSITSCHWQMEKEWFIWR